MPTLLETVHSAGKYIETPVVSRPYAVAAALEVIAGLAASGSPATNLAAEFENLSLYADKIQEALKVK
ncbi:hypothetical protein [Pseudomonas sp. CF161]|uniref:hypothetical protein n=1 Tax=Pseudomonas sp. CF161 TaxID=911241 RepID=UPI0003552CFF|nr:hypothetical protein [Pseudomonas sp. CF161]EPL03893.1 hypothetical protein CF161_28780 [Pseudomonas sp. CF161]